VWSGGLDRKSLLKLKLFRKSFFIRDSS
jgi:hypothetical protein